MMSIRLNPEASRNVAGSVAGLALAGIVLAGCVPNTMGLASRENNTGAVQSALKLFDDAPKASGLVLAKAEQAEKPLLQPAQKTGIAPATRIVLQADDLRLRTVKGRENSYQLALPRLTALGDSAGDAEKLLVSRVQEVLRTAGQEGAYNQTQRLLTLTLTSEAAQALAAPLEALRQEVAFARYTVEVWAGLAPQAVGKGAELPVADLKGGQVTAQAVAVGAVSEPRLAAAGGRKLQQETRLVLIDNLPVQFSYAAPVDYVATSSSLAGSMNMTVERFPTRLSAQLQTRRRGAGAEATLTLVGKALERFREEKTAGMTLKMPLPKTISARVPFMPTADKAVVVAGLRGFGRPCLQDKQYCPYELVGNGQPQEQEVTVIARTVVYMAEALAEPVAQPPVQMLAEGKAVLGAVKAPAVGAAAPKAPLAAMQPTTQKPGLAEIVQPVWNQKPAVPAAVAAESAVAKPVMAISRAAKTDSPLPDITPAPVKPVAIAKNAEGLPPVPQTAAMQADAAGKRAEGKPIAAPEGFKAKPMLAPIAVMRGAPAMQGKQALGKAEPAQEAMPQQALLDLMANTPRGKLVERPVSSARRKASPIASDPLPKDPAQVDWAAWDAELEASVGDTAVDPMQAAAPVAAAAAPAAALPKGATVIQKPSGVHVFRGAPGVKISPEAMKRLMALDARQAEAEANKSKDTTLLGQLRDKAHLQGVMMVYDKEKK